MKRNLKYWICLASLCLIPLIGKAVTPGVAAGLSHSLAVDANGGLSSWGDDSYGQLGIGRRVASNTPIAVSVTGQFRKVASGPGHNLALKTDGTLWAWGRNNVGQVGNGSSLNVSAPVQIGSGFADVEVGGSYWNGGHSLALKTDGTLWAWGQNEVGQLGDSTTTSRLRPVQIGSGFAGIAGGGAHSVAVKTDGTLWAWGSNDSGQLGDGTTTNRMAPVQIGTGFVAVAAGEQHSLAKKSDGTLWAWGLNSNGQVGNGTTTNQLRPVQIGTGYASIGAGVRQSFAARTDGTLWAWGRNSACYLGDGTSTDRLTPLQIGSGGFTTVSAGDWHGLALKNDGTIWAWGWNDSGQIGDGTNTTRCTPVPVGSGYKALAAGLYHSLAVKTDGTLWIWGSNYFGALGDGTPFNRSSPLHIGDGFATSSASWWHSLAVKTDGTLWAWGWNDWNQLCDGTTLAKSTPKQVGSGLAKVAGGSYHSLAIKTDGTLWACGGNFDGQLGNGTTANQSGLVQVGSGFAAVAAGDRHSLGVKTDGTLWAWGSNGSGQLGDGTTTNRTTPVQIGSGFKAVAAGLYHSLAVKTDGTLWAWGWNSSGQAGDKSMVWSRSTPLMIGSGFATVAAGGEHSLALKTDGSVWAWGSNQRGQLGDGTITNSSSPVRVSLLSSVVSVTAVGGNYGLALKTDGSVAAWGSNDIGQLGDGTLAQRRSPVLVVNSSINDYLNLKPGTTLNVPPELRIPFFVSSSGSVTSTSATVSITANFTNTNTGTNAAFVTARVPSGSLGSGTVQSNTLVTTASSASSLVLMQLTPTGWQSVTNGQLIPYVSGVLGNQLDAQNILNGTDTTNLKGAEFCLGYGTSAQEMSAAGRMRVVATIPDPNATSAPTVGCQTTLVPQGWTLLGNTLDQSLQMASLFNDSSWVTSVWKWDAAQMRWQFYSPSLDTSALQSFAVSKGFGILSEIGPGEGYWINAKAAGVLGTPSANLFNLTKANLATGWNLVATGVNVTPSVFNTSLSTTPPATGVPQNLISVWTWDNLQSKWYFYAPSLEARGGSALTDYISSHGYLDFTAANKTLGSGVGFWVNKP